MKKSYKTTFSFSGKKGFDKTFDAFSKTFENLGNVFENLGNVFEDMDEEDESISVTSTAGSVVIEGDVKNVIVNGEVVWTKPK